LLRVHAAHEPPGGAGEARGEDTPAAVAADLAVELRLLAGWLGLEDVAVGDRGGEPKGSLAGALTGALAAG
jgi:uncharacterized protein YcaQ